jgi:preprotein translocase subunit SecE
MNARDTVIEPVQRLRSFLEESWAELKRVHFPTRAETQGATVVVVLGVVVVAAYLGLVDFVVTQAIFWLLPQ